MGSCTSRWAPSFGPAQSQGRGCPQRRSSRRHYSGTGAFVRLSWWLTWWKGWTHRQRTRPASCASAHQPSFTHCVLVHVFCGYSENPGYNEPPIQGTPGYNNPSQWVPPWRIQVKSRPLQRIPGYNEPFAREKIQQKGFFVSRVHCTLRVSEQLYTYCLGTESLRWDSGSPVVMADMVVSRYYAWVH